MAREDSLDESERSLTPDLEEDEVPTFDARSPTYGSGGGAAAAAAAAPLSPNSNGNGNGNGTTSPTTPPAHTHTHNPLVALSRITSAHSKKSRVSRTAAPASAAPPTPRRPVIAPKERFRSAVRKVMSLHRGTTLLGAGGGANIGAEPGVDPRRPAVDAAYRHVRAPCQIEVVDYSAVRSAVRAMGNGEFVGFLERGAPREPWVKVRWINVGGVSWDVVKALAIRYDLHPLALEDVFHGHARNRSKADYYTKHLFLRVLCHELLDEDADDASSSAGPGMTDAPRSASPEPIADYADADADSEDLIKHGGTPPPPPAGANGLTKRRFLAPSRTPILPTAYGNGAGAGAPRTPMQQHQFSLLAAKDATLNAQSSERRGDEDAVRTLKKGSRVNVAVSPMYFFLFRDGTVISIRPTVNLDFTAPISTRLKSRDTVLRKAADPSLLVHALLDLIVDKAIQVIDQYHVKIHKFEKQILLHPNMSTVRELHILSGDLILRKRTLDPIKTMIYALRRYDVDRCAALIDSSDPANENVKVVGFMSHKAKIYLADAYDHMEYILTSLDMFAGIADNLINYSFNVASYEMNEVMRRLTIVTIIFLPLTVLTGYFGMNFDSMWSLRHSDIFFWELALPMVALVVPIALMADLKKLWHYIQKRRNIRAP